MATNVSSLLLALRLAQNGHTADAEALIVDGSTEPDVLLLRGYLLLCSSPEAAKDLLAQARRLLIGELSYQAAIYEARAYEYLGQSSEGLILIEEVLKAPGLGAELRAQALLVKAVFQMERPRRAITTLNKIGMKDLDPGLKGRIHNQRGRMYKELREFDRALIEYAGSAAFFEEADHTDGVAHAVNNVAGLYREMGRFREAHEASDRALKLIAPGDPHISEFKDQKARTFVAEGKLVEAVILAREAVALVDHTDRVAVLAENLCTLGQALAGLHEYPEASECFSRAKSISEYLENDDMLFRVTSSRKTVAENFAIAAERELIILALKICKNSGRAAARKLGITHTGLQKSIVRLNVRVATKDAKSAQNKTRS